MPEIKHNFIKGRMNKDLDERLVPNGEYREALNVEVVNSEGSDMGSVQTTMGNVLKSAGVPDGICIGSITNEKEDKLYWCTTSEATPWGGIYANITSDPNGRMYRDIIAEYDYNTNAVTPVVVDIWMIEFPWVGSNLALVGSQTQFTLDNITGISAGMKVQFLTVAITHERDIINVTPTGGTTGIITVNTSFVASNFISGLRIINPGTTRVIPAITLPGPIVIPAHEKTEIERVLNFNPNYLITGINIIPASDETTAEGILFWTDNNSEPKRVNINRSKLGSIQPPLPGAWDTHTNFMVRDTSPGSLPNAYVVSGLIKEKHVTVIRQGPPAAPVLEMRSSKEDEITEAQIDSSGGNPFIDPVTLALNTSTPVDISFIGCPTPPNCGAPCCPGFDVGDHLIISCPDDIATLQTNESDKKIRVVINSINTFGNSTTISWVYSVSVLSGDSSIKPDQSDFDVELEKTDPLFQFKFPRFAYRYKYEDGEYSPFSPFTQVAFLPDDFYYLPKEGYNLGMVNQLRFLAIKDFVHPRLLPDDVISVDILYKESNSPNVYSVKTIKRKVFVGGVWNEWNGISDSISQQSGVRGYMKITSELIHATLPSNQLLRPWDNVPRKALAQEISGNRLIYGNYLQNYDLYNNSTSEKDIDVRINVTVHSEDIADNNLNPAQKDPWFIPRASNQYLPAKSVKTLRTYQVGVIYIDEYGRETPVFSNDKTGGPTNTSTSTVYIDKLVADQSNSLTAEIKNTVPEWAKAFKYFIKETSNEYYNLAMDRWYDAEDGNVWLSFPSSERNKVDIDTFLILKKEHDDNIFVDSPARYKILAIDNEAPTFIKQENLSMGIFIDDSNGDLIGPGGIGFPLPQRREIWLDGNAFDNLGWNTTIMGNDDINNMYLRIKSVSNRTNWYQISSIGVSPSGGSNYVIKTKKLFGDDMAITSANNSHGSRYGNLELEIVNRKPTHKAEFDGRFFVKILKDLTFVNRIIKPATAEEEYITKYSKKVQYINPQSPHDNSSGPPGPGVEDWHGFNYDKRGISYHNNPHGGTDWGWEPSHGEMHGPGYWGYAGISVLDDHDSTGWFIDKVESFRRFQFAKRHNQQHNNHGYRTVAASSATGRQVVNAVYGGGYSDPDHSIQALHVRTGGMDLPGPNSYKDLANETSSEGGKIVPSVGIANEDVIHLSFAGYGGSHGGGIDPNTWGETKLDLTTWSDYAGDIVFGNEISTPGTLWRWKEDPDQITYKTVTNPGLTSQSNSTFDANTHDSFSSSERGIGLYNYVSFTDYLMKTHHYARLDIITNVIYTPTTYWASSKIGNDYYRSWVPWQDLLYLDEITLGALVLHALDSGISKAGAWGVNTVHNNYPQLIEDWNKAGVKRRRFQFVAKQMKDETLGLGSGLRQYLPTNDPTFDAHFDSNYNILDINTGHPVTGGSFPDPAPGIRFDGMWSGMSNTHSANNGPEIPNTKTWIEVGTGPGSPPAFLSGDQTRAPGSVTWQILESYTADTEAFSSVHPAIWETEPKEDVGLDIYYEVGQIYPTELNKYTIEQHVGPVHTNSSIPDVKRLNSYVKCWRPGAGWITLSVPPGSPCDTALYPDCKINIRISAIQTDTANIAIQNTGENGTGFGGGWNPLSPGGVPPQVGDILVFVRSNGGETQAEIANINGFWIEFKPNVHNKPVTLPWHNCYSFGNGVESDRVRDDYNQVTIDNGPKASTTLEEPYLEERRCSGLIYSGIYNSLSGVNNLNQFIQAEKITKDLNPSYGCIQKLHSRNTNLITLCEDKVLTILANKDAMFNADGNVNVTSNLNVLGQAMPTSKAEYGISKNPESFASQADRIYFADKSRGAVLRLGQDGLTPISSAGMKDYFSDNLVNANNIIGSFDDRKGSYNITFGNTTLSYTENARGWTSFKSFVQEDGLSLNSSYYTFKKGQLWEHHVNPIRNNFYSTPLVNNQFDSSIKFLFNDVPGSVKSFNTLNYEGSQSRITQNLNDPDYYNNVAKDGWYVDMIETNLQTGDNLEFKDKEGKWFSTIKGETTSLQNLDEREFSVQGIGNASVPPAWNSCLPCNTFGANNSSPGCCDNLASNYSSSATCDDGSCIPNIYGCMDDGFMPNSYVNNQGGTGSYTPGTAALNYYSAANIDNGSCIYPPDASWDCDPFGNCYDPGTGSGLYTTLAACNAVCACAPIVGPAGPGYFLTTQDDTGTCTSPNNDGSVTWSLTIPNFTAGDQWTHQIKTSSGGQVNMPTTLYTVNGGDTTTSLPPDNYDLLVVHASGPTSPYPGGLCSYVITFTIGCSNIIPSWNCVSGTCLDPGTGSGLYTSLAACNTACAVVPSWDCDPITGQCSDPGTGLGAWPTQASCYANCWVASWNCDPVTSSCVDPGTGTGIYNSLAACNAFCGVPSWKCSGQFGVSTLTGPVAPWTCYDPGNGLGQYSTLATCNAICSAPIIIYPPCRLVENANFSSPLLLNSPGVDLSSAMQLSNPITNGWKTNNYYTTGNNIGTSIPPYINGSNNLVLEGSQLTGGTYYEELGIYQRIDNLVGGQQYTLTVEIVSITPGVYGPGGMELFLGVAPGSGILFTTNPGPNAVNWNNLFGIHTLVAPLQVGTYTYTGIAIGTAPVDTEILSLWMYVQDNAQIEIGYICIEPLL